MNEPPAPNQPVPALGVTRPDEVGSRRRVVRHARRTAVFIAGWAVVLAGVSMLILPGPGLLVVVAGLSILAVEFAWARRMRDQAKERLELATKGIRSRVRRPSKPPAPDQSSTDKRNANQGAGRSKDLNSFVVPPTEERL